MTSHLAQYLLHCLSFAHLARRHAKTRFGLVPCGLNAAVQGSLAIPFLTVRECRRLESCLRDELLLMPHSIHLACPMTDRCTIGSLLAFLAGGSRLAHSACLTAPFLACHPSCLPSFILNPLKGCSKMYAHILQEHQLQRATARATLHIV